MDIQHGLYIHFGILEIREGNDKIDLFQNSLTATDFRATFSALKQPTNNKDISKAELD